MSNKEPVNLNHSIHSRLRNWSRKNNLDHNFVMNRYACERLLYRLSISKYANQFILKGAMLFSIWSDEPFRPTKDIDLLGFGEDSEERLRRIFQQVCSIKPKQPDGISYKNQWTSNPMLQIFLCAVFAINYHTNTKNCKFVWQPIGPCYHTKYNIM